MQVRCVRAFGHHVPGDVAEVPDGASVDPGHWEPVTVPPPAPVPAPGAPLSVQDVISDLSAAKEGAQ